MTENLALRRHLLLAALPLALLGTSQAEELNPAETIVTPPDRIPWKERPGWPKNSVISAPLFGARDKPGLYYELIKWYPGYMSAPHSYATDRLCVVVSGTWWVNSGGDFDPRHCKPVPPGSFVRRVAHSPHYAGVIAGGAEPAVIAICGMAPVEMKYIETGRPGWRRV